MNQGTGTNGDVATNRRAVIALNLGHMDDCTISNTSIFSNCNLVNIASNCRTIPDTTIYIKESGAVFAFNNIEK